MKRTHSWRMLAPPPVPVTHPKCQNFAHSSGIRLAGCWASVDLIRWSLLLETSCGDPITAMLPASELYGRIKETGERWKSRSERNGCIKSYIAIEAMMWFGRHPLPIHCYTIFGVRDYLNDCEIVSGAQSSSSD